MKIEKNGKDITIPNWLIFIGILAVDNIAGNVLTVIDNKIHLKSMEKKNEEEAQ